MSFAQLQILVMGNTEQIEEQLIKYLNRELEEVNICTYLDHFLDTCTSLKKKIPYGPAKNK